MVEPPHPSQMIHYKFNYTLSIFPFFPLSLISLQFSSSPARPKLHQEPVNSWLWLSSSPSYKLPEGNLPSRVTFYHNVPQIKSIQLFHCTYETGSKCSDFVIKLSTIFPCSPCTFQFLSKMQSYIIKCVCSMLLISEAMRKGVPCSELM